MLVLIFVGIFFLGNFLFSEYTRKSFSPKFIFAEQVIFFAGIYLYDRGENLFFVELICANFVSYSQKYTIAKVSSIKVKGRVKEEIKSN